MPLTLGSTFSTCLTVADPDSEPDGTDATATVVHPLPTTLGRTAAALPDGIAGRAPDGRLGDSVTLVPGGGLNRNTEPTGASGRTT